MRLSSIKIFFVVSLISVLSHSIPLLSEVSSIHGDDPGGSTTDDKIDNSSTDEGPLTEPGIDTDPTSDRGIFDIFNLFLIIIMFLFIALVAIISILLFRKFMIRDVEWIEDPYWTDDEGLDDEPLPEDGLITRGDL